MTDEIKEEATALIEPKTETPVKEVAKKVVKRRGPAKKAAEKAETAFEFSDADIQEFKEWKKDKKVRDQVTCDSADDDKVYRRWKEESKLVKGVFRCLEPIGGNVKFAFRKYKWDSTQWYTMFDGETYEVPLAVARHLNNNCNYNVHSHILGADGNPLLNTSGKPKSRMNFESTTFTVA